MFYLDILVVFCFQGQESTGDRNLLHISDHLQASTCAKRSVFCHCREMSQHCRTFFDEKEVTKFLFEGGLPGWLQDVARASFTPHSCVECFGF